MGRKALSLDEQIALLRSRGMVIHSEEKAKEILMDIGYYKLGFYWYPFEIPSAKNEYRTHKFYTGSDFDDSVRLYYFDYELRSLLLKHISRIEVNLKTLLVYYVSNEYPNLPTWFVSPLVVNKDYISKFDKEVYTANVRRNKVISQHHHNHINDKYAPAWKTLEFMTLGNIITLYKSLNNIELKKRIAENYGFKYTKVFDNYLDVVRSVRNICAHGGVLYDIDFYPLIRKGPAGVIGYEDRKLHGAIKVIHYLLGFISRNRAIDFKKELNRIVKTYITTPVLENVLMNVSGF